MNIVFARHGNTFGPGDKVVWVGRETDLPLVEKGWEQARAAGEALKRRGIVPDAVYCAGLKRTRSTAETMVGVFGGAVSQPVPQPVVDRRLDEIDYGTWAGRTSDEIAGLSGGAERLRVWSKLDQWPVDAGWVTSEAEMMAGLRAFIAEVLDPAPDNATLLVVSSNGVLRFLPRLFGLPASRSYQMKTGHLGLVTREDGNYRLRGWNLAPGEFGTALV
ncbi:Phosphoglycerate mutase [uncultured Gammaproteobacteria bacterium]